MRYVAVLSPFPQILIGSAHISAPDIPQNAPNEIPKDVEVPKNTRNWAKGSRETFLESYFPRYQAAHLQSIRRAADLIDVVVNKYFQVYHWSLPLTSEPAPFDVARNPHAPEILTVPEAAHKQKVVQQMKGVRPFL